MISQRCPGKHHRPGGHQLLQLGKVTTEPGTTPPRPGRERDREQRDHGPLASCASSSSATSAAAPPPTPLNSATSCGIRVIFTRRETGHGDDRSRPRWRRGSRPGCRARSTGTPSPCATSAPNAPIRLPRRAVRGADRPLQREDEADRGHQVQQRGPVRASSRFTCCHPPCSDRLPVTARPLNISSIRSVTTKPPTRFTVASTTASSATDEDDGVSAWPATRTAPTQDDAVDGVGARHQRACAGCSTPSRPPRSRRTPPARRSSAARSPSIRRLPSRWARALSRPPRRVRLRA